MLRRMMQVGLVVTCTTIDHLLIGAPAHLCDRLQPVQPCLPPPAQAHPDPPTSTHAGSVERPLRLGVACM